MTRMLKKFAPILPALFVLGIGVILIMYVTAPTNMRFYVLPRDKSILDADQMVDFWRTVVSALGCLVASTSFVGWLILWRYLHPDKQ